jgi:hypothetical protein
MSHGVLPRGLGQVLKDEVTAALHHGRNRRTEHTGCEAGASLERDHGSRCQWQRQGRYARLLDEADDGLERQAFNQAPAARPSCGWACLQRTSQSPHFLTATTSKLS